MFPHGSFCLTGWSGIFLSASLYAFSSFFFCCCSAAVCSSLFLPSLPPPLPCPIWACAGAASPTIIAQIRHLHFRNETKLEPEKRSCQSCSEARRKLM